MVRTVMVNILAVFLTGLAVVVVLLVQEQRQQSRELTRLAECVSILERNRSVPDGSPIMACPIYN